MSRFPQRPVPAADFVEQLLPALLGPPGLAAGAAGLSARLGFALAGEGGGAWTLVLRSRGLEIESGLDAPLTLGLSTRDWRGALWESRGGALGAFLARILGAEAGDGALGLALRFDVAVVEKLAELDATLRLQVLEEVGEDWTLDLRLGPGPIASRAEVTVAASERDTHALAAGELDPMSALMTGRIRVEGEMSLLVQVQALLQQARG